MNQVATLPKRSLVDSMAARYDMEPAAFVNAIKASVIKGQVSNEQFAAFLMVAKEYDLNPLLKEIYAFPSNGGIQPIVSIDGWMKLINSHPQFDGMEFKDEHGEDGKLYSVECRMHRKDRTRPICVIEYMSECFRKTPTWQQWPSRMLRHKAAIQAARYTFGFSEIMEPDEYERMRDVTPKASVVADPLSDEPIAAQSGAESAGDKREGFSSDFIEHEAESTSTTTNSDDSTLSSQAVSDDAGETPPSPAELDGDGESSSPSSPSEEELEPEGVDRKWLVTVWKTLRAAVGEDPGVVERQTVVFAESAKARNKATRDKAQAVKRSLMRVCEGADLDEEIKYAAGIIGVDREELVGGADASS